MPSDSKMVFFLHHLSTPKSIYEGLFMPSGFSEVSKNRDPSKNVLVMLGFCPEIIQNLVEFTKLLEKQHKTDSSPMISLTEKLY